MATMNEVRDLIESANAQLSQCKAKRNELDDTIGKRVSELEILVYKEISKSESEIDNPIHHEVCSKMAELHEKYGIPMPYIAVVAVSSDAHKISSFHKGYKKCDTKMFGVITKWAKMFAEHNGVPSFEKKLPTLQLMAKYYKNRSKNTKQFCHDLNDFPIAKHIYGVREMATMLRVGSLENIMFLDHPMRDGKGRFIKSK